jgi:hypothetical protein
MNSLTWFNEARWEEEGGGKGELRWRNKKKRVKEKEKLECLREVEEKRGLGWGETLREEGIFRWRTRTKKSRITSKEGEHDRNREEKGKRDEVRRRKEKWGGGEKST